MNVARVRAAIRPKGSIRARCLQSPTRGLKSDGSLYNARCPENIAPALRPNPPPRQTIVFNRCAYPWRRVAALLVATIVLAGCATRPVNPPLDRHDAGKAYRVERQSETAEDNATLVILAFSGGGTRAAAFSYGVLETLRDMQSTTKSGRLVRVLDTVDVITGISGGSFTALAFGLYGDKLFDVYETAFLKRNVQGDLVSKALNPLNWPALGSTGWGRSELAANFYDEILFKGATYNDLRRDGPRILVSATDLAEGTRLIFNTENFDVLCSNLAEFRLARAAAASSAVPVVLSSITIDNYGGTCDFQKPPWTKLFVDTANPPRPAARTVKRLQELQAFANRAERPYLHLVDGGVSDNVGMRGVLDTLEIMEALQEAGVPTVLDQVRRVVVFVVNSMSAPAIDWDKSESPPGAASIMLKSAGVPIDNFSFESIELLNDMAQRWRTMRLIRNSAAMAANKDPAVLAATRAPLAEIYAIDVSFSALKDKEEVAYLNSQPTSFVLTDEAVDRLRAAAGKIIMDSPEFQRLLRDVGARIVSEPAK